MKCPKCMKDNTTIISNTHYVCNDPKCVDDDGNRIQFKFITDKKIKFPYNQIFIDRNVEKFFRKPYLEIEMTGIKNIIK